MTKRERLNRAADHLHSAGAHDERISGSVYWREIALRNEDGGTIITKTGRLMLIERLVALKNYRFDTDTTLGGTPVKADAQRSLLSAVRELMF